MRRLLLLTACTLAAVFIDDPTTAPPIHDPIGRLSGLPPEVAAATVLRAAIVLVGTTQIGVAFVAVCAEALGRVRFAAATRRLLIPALRSTAPLVVAVGTALPASASVAVVPPVEPPSPARPARVIRVEVVPGDSLWRIAEATNTDGDVDRHWRAIVELNRHRFDDVDLIHPGEVVLVPPLSRAGSA